MTAPVLAVGDGALGFWKAVREVFPDTGSSGAGSTSRPMSLLLCRNRLIRARWRRCGRSTTPRTSIKAQVAIKAFEVDYGAKYPKAVAKNRRQRRRPAGVLQVSRRALGPLEDY